MSSSSDRMSLLDPTPVLDARPVSLHHCGMERNTHSLAAQNEQLRGQADSASVTVFAAHGVGVSLYSSAPEPTSHRSGGALQSLVMNTVALSLSEPPEGKYTYRETAVRIMGETHQREGLLRLSPSEIMNQGFSTGSTLSLKYSNGSCPPHGVKAVCGKRNKMEDAFAVLPNFCELPLNSPSSDMPDKFPIRIAAQMDGTTHSSTSPSTSLPSSAAGEHEQTLRSTSSSEGSIETFHFFGVYDGHGGVEAADHCARRLHQVLSEVMTAAASSLNAELTAEPLTSLNDVDRHLVSKVAEDVACKSSPSSPSTASGHGIFPPAEKAVDDAIADRAAPEVNDDLASSFETATPDCCAVAAMLESSLREAFLKTDAEFATDDSSALVGSTAVVALVGSVRIYVANCGDSRAVLSRGGKAIQLTDDHKPEREDEAERVEKAGGQVLYWNGHRVMGILAMSRAIGDHCLRPYVIPEPEITIVNRTDEDELLLLASDGLWDVMTNQEAASLAGRCLQKARERGASRRAAARIAASVLTRAAIDRGSKDNVTVVIVDLRYCAPEEDQGRDEDPPSMTTSMCGVDPTVLPAGDPPQPHAPQKQAAAAAAVLAAAAAATSHTTSTVSAAPELAGAESAGDARHTTSTVVAASQPTGADSGWDASYATSTVPAAPELTGAGSARDAGHTTGTAATASQPTDADSAGQAAPEPTGADSARLVAEGQADGGPDAGGNMADSASSLTQPATAGLAGAQDWQPTVAPAGCHSQANPIPEQGDPEDLGLQPKAETPAVGSAFAQASAQHPMSRVVVPGQQRAEAL